MQRLTAGKLVARARGDAEIWLDGGHNPAAGLVIAEAVADLEERVPRPLFMICGMLNTKDPVGFFQPFAGLAAQGLHRAGAVARPPGATRRSSPRRRGAPGSTPSRLPTSRPRST